MSDTVFRTKTVTETVPSKPIEAKEATSSAIVNDVEVPYLDYSNEHSHPYLVDYFKLGDTWNDPQGGFPKEIAQIEQYISEKIKSGEVANSVTAIKNIIKDMEKVTNMSKEERSVVKIEVLANYVDFLMKTDQVKRNVRIYANT